MFFPLAAFRREGALVDPCVKTRLGPHGEFVGTTIAAHPHDEGIEAGEVLLDGRRAHRCEATVVLQGYRTAKHHAVGENFKAARGDTAHHVIVDDLPRGGVGGGRVVEKSSVGSGFSVHGQSQASPRERGERAEGD